MIDFMDDLSNFLAERRNKALGEACGNKVYAELKAKAIGLSKKLIVSAPASLQSQLINLLDDISAIGSYETKYCYLCGLRDGGKVDVSFNPTDSAPEELREHKQYACIQEAVAEAENRLRGLLSVDAHAMLDEYLKTKQIMLGIEKSYCYPGGLRDWKWLSHSFNPEFGKEWEELLNAFL